MINIELNHSCEIAIIETFYCAETIANLCVNKLVLTHLRMKLPSNYTPTNHMYTLLNVYKQMIIILGRIIYVW